MNHINFVEYFNEEPQSDAAARYKSVFTQHAADILDKRTSLGNIMPIPHWHPYYELMFILEGTYTVVCSGRSLQCSKPGAYLFMPHALHQINADTRCTYTRYQISISKSLVHRFEGDILHMEPYANAGMLYLTPDDRELAALTNIVESMKAMSSDPGLISLYAGILMRRILMGVESGNGGALYGTQTYIQGVLEYIYQNLASPPTVAELAARCGVCQSKFYSDFKATIGITYKQYMTTLRQGHACSMLKRGESIIRTSLECGYCSEAHFIKAFREYWGITPGEFIKNQQEQR
ncbi:MAG: helix-turn-helix transcriptional regulator [Clostridia bacterium]|nr:helix-turn-helix transcriptional regulator [Clostridia bacterium]